MIQPIDQDILRKREKNQLPLSSHITCDTDGGNKERFIKGNKSHKTTQIRGTNEVRCSLRSADRKAWLFVGRVNKVCSEINLASYLSVKLPDRELNSSIKVGIDFELLEQVNREEFWPVGILAKRYLFFDSVEDDKTNEHFKLLNLNIQPINGQIDQLEELLNEKKINIAVITEHWLDKAICKNLNLHNYRVGSHFSRRNGYGVHLFSCTKN
ncbi:hypothetical protein HHI36_009023 [Cryptolaemus montrouzieri]|uniref:Uncharacterized protein n=1 Tax=Cryptolaemus montrouzieri TaxID=559131 RepID=A0ABD2MUA3_9CUCU